MSSKQQLETVGDGMIMKSSFAKKLDEIYSAVEESNAMAKHAMDVVQGYTNISSTPPQFRRKQYATLYETCEVSFKYLFCPTYIVPSTTVPDDFFSIESNIQLQGKKKREVQLYGNCQFRKFESQMTLVQHDTHEAPFFANSDGDRPDNVFCPSNLKASQLVAVSALEWKRYPQEETTAFDFEEKGQAIRYAQLILDAQKWRSHSVVCICNLEWFQCFEAKRFFEDIRVYEYQAVKFGTLGRNILWGIITSSTDSLGFVMEQPIGYQHAKQLVAIACGGSAIVYQIPDDSETGESRVVKVYRDAFLASKRNEVEIYRHISGKLPSIGELLEAGENYIVLRNYGKKLLNLFHPASCYKDVLLALQFAHSLGITHNDVKPRNILVTKGSNQAVLVDWGIGMMSSSNSGQAFKEQKKEDVQSLIRLFIVNKIFNGIELLEESFEKLRYHVPMFCVPLIELACNCEYEELLGLLSL